MLTRHTGGRHSILVLHAGIVFSLSLSGCSTPTTPKSVDSPSSSVAPSDAVNLHLPIEKYLYSDAELRTLKEAIQILSVGCLRRHGISYTPPTPPPPMGPRSLMDRRYGITDESMAREYGYHLGDRDPRTHPQATSSPPPARILAALSGESVDGVKPGKHVPPHGCAGEAKNKIAGANKVGSSDTALDINIQSFKATQQENRAVSAAFRAWSDCMEGVGYSYSDPLAATNDKRFQGDKISPDEVATAKADISCKKQTGLVSIWFKAETAHQNRLIQQENKSLTVALKEKEKQISGAEAVIQAAEQSASPKQ